MKTFKLLAVCCLSLIILIACDEKKKSIKGADGTEYESYQSACRNQDFVAAYNWIEKNNGSEEDKDYVFNAEMLYLTSLGTEEASNRIVYLLAEYQIPGTPISEGDALGWHGDELNEGAKKYIEGITRFNKRCDNVLDLAIAQGNKELAKKIINLYKKDVNVREDLINGQNVVRCKPISKKAAQEKFNEAFGDVEEAENQDHH